MAQEDKYPGGFSTNTISNIWDGHTLKLSGLKGETLYSYMYLLGGSANASNVMVGISSFTGTGTAVGSGFASVQVSSSNVWNFAGRPYTLYYYPYGQQIIGMSTVDIAWDPTEYDEQQLPPRWRVPCTLNGNNQCSPNGSAGTGTYTFLNRQDNNKHYPDPAIPLEEVAIASFSVSASSSQAIGLEVYISSFSLPAGVYTSTITVYENGTTVSTQVPVQVTVLNAVMPAPGIMVPAYVNLGDFSMRLTGTRFPASYFVDPYLTNTLRIGAFLHRKRVIMIGDQVTAGNDYPSPVWNNFLNGNAYSSTYGLDPNSGPGYGVADKFYMIGTYGSWVTSHWSTSTVSGTNGFCTNASSWTYYCNTNNVKCLLYTSNDEASDAILAGEVNTLSTWLSTAPTCAYNGNTLPMIQTDDLPDVAANAPNVSTVWSTSWLGSSSSTWASQESSYLNSSTHSAGGYNSGVGVDSILNIQEEGLGSREPFWGAYKTSQPSWFIWSIEYWNDANNGGQLQNGFNANTNNDNDMYNITKDFGYDVYPTTSAYRGHTGFGFTDGDGNMLYPATDVVYANPNYNLNGVIGSWRLNQIDRGIQDYTLLKTAYAVNPSSTTTIINQAVQDVMYLRQCFTLADCSYSYGPRPWDETINDWESFREQLETIIVNAPSPPPSPGSTPSLIFGGGLTFQ